MNWDTLGWIALLIAAVAVASFVISFMWAFGRAFARDLSAWWKSR